MSVVSREVIPQTPESPDSRTLMTLIERLATSPDLDLTRLEKMLELKERWDANEARKAFVSAMAEFKADPVRIIKSKKADIPGGAKYSYATLADVYDGALTELSKHGLSHRFEILQDRLITVTCIVTHELGHSERVTLSAPPDDSGKKNTVQQIASTVHYLERYTFLAATGLASRDMDNDAKDTGKKVPQIEVPNGYEKWKADMTAKADEGSEALRESWAKSGDFRGYAATVDSSWWNDTKARANKISKAAAKAPA